MKLLEVSDARARILATVSQVPAEEAPLCAALGRVLAADIRAGRAQPPFDASAMDGWAVRAADTPGRLKIVGESAAGHGYAGALAAGEAVRIFTGAAVPWGADWIVIQEDAQRDGDHVIAPAAALPNHIRAAGMDFSAGERLLERGVRLDPWRLALAAAAGHGIVSVSRRPQVVILSTGEEVVPPGASPGPFQIFDSGSTALQALATTWGAEVSLLAGVGDDAEATANAVARGGGDLVVTLGGASVGDHDIVKPALGRLGLELRVESVAVRPGKPTWFGVLGDGRKVLGLPGNPASALVCAELFLKPLLLAMQGADPALPMEAAVLDAALRANGAREHWMRARLSRRADGRLSAAPFPDQDSSLVSVFAEADALIRRAAGAPALGRGEIVETLRLARL